MDHHVDEITFPAGGKLTREMARRLALTGVPALTPTSAEASDAHNHRIASNLDAYMLRITAAVDGAKYIMDASDAEPQSIDE